MLELLVGCGGRDEEAVLVTGSQTADDASSGDCGVADRNDILEFGFEDTAPGQYLPSATKARYCARPRAHLCIPVEVLRSTYCDNRIGVGECGEDTDSAQLVSTCHVPVRICPALHILVGVLELRADSHVVLWICDMCFLLVWRG